MYNAISGTLSYKGPDYIRIDNHGIEWECSVPSRSVDLFGSIGDQVRALVWLLHREDGMRLFGFATESERAVFLELLGVDGIGPKAAIKILGGISPGELERALESEDLSRLEAVPGLGKKTAQKLVFSLKGKLPSALVQKGGAPTAGAHEDIVRALVDMGYDRKRCVEAVNAIAADADISSVRAEEREREIFRRVIVGLSGS
jgi:Holliday junction DNA helicase RuvA